MLQRRFVSLIVTFASLIVMAGCGAAPLGAEGPDPLASLRSAWVAALEQQDLEASLALFTPDAIFLSPGGERYDDRAAIRTLYRSVFAAYRSHISLSSKRQDCSDKLCVDEGTYDETMTENATSKKLPIGGSYILVARREPDGWKITEMVWTGGPR
jgi:uncharacterized protein (TIGR02246 family)